MNKKQQALFQAFIRADQLGIRLEIVGGLPVWEAQPVLRHRGWSTEFEHRLSRLIQAGKAINVTTSLAFTSASYSQR